MQPRRKTGLPPNNRLTGWDQTPAIAWNDVEVLARAGRATGTEPALGTTAHANAIVAFFEKHKQDAPTFYAVTAWVRRGVVPDRWRAALVYLLMLDSKIATNQLFKRVPRTPAQVVCAKTSP